jgi:hypothetical protein
MNCGIGSEENAAQCKLVQSSKEKYLKEFVHRKRPNEHCRVDSWNWTNQP